MFGKLFYYRQRRQFRRQLLQQCNSLAYCAVTANYQKGDLAGELVAHQNVTRFHHFVAEHDISRQEMEKYLRQYGLEEGLAQFDLALARQRWLSPEEFEERRRLLPRMTDEETERVIAESLQNLSNALLAAEAGGDQLDALVAEILQGPKDFLVSEGRADLINNLPHVNRYA